VVTPRARSNIRYQLKQQQQVEARALGRKLLKKNLSDFGCTLEDLSQSQIDKVLEHNQIPNIDKLYEDIGLGTRMAFILARQLVAGSSESALAVKAPEAGSHPPLLIEGTEGALIRFAHCCKPIPGDPIVGISGGGDGLTIHSETCERVRDMLQNPERCTHLSWAKNISDEFSVALQVAMAKRRGMIAEIASAVSLADANIEKISVDEQNARLSTVSMVIKVQGRNHLARVMRRLRNLKSVSSLGRIKH
jgi:guanosine-3',5'-bis(diphosphate) 3'-pyrophosphohydrolase